MNHVVNYSHSWFIKLRWFLYYLLFLPHLELLIWVRVLRMLTWFKDDPCKWLGSCVHVLVAKVMWTKDNLPGE